MFGADVGRGFSLGSRTGADRAGIRSLSHERTQRFHLFFVSSQRVPGL